MKRFFTGILVGFAAVLILACQTAAPVSKKVEIEGEVTQEKVNSALEQIYDTYRTKLDFTGAQDYTVVRGDTLSQITRKYYGSLTNVGDAGPNNGFYFPVIMMAADSNIVDPDLIEPGMKLKIVDIQRNLANPVSKQAIRDALIEVAYVYNKKGAASTEDGLKKLADSL
jgi:LysM repeat protein